MLSLSLPQLRFRGSDDKSWTPQRSGLNGYECEYFIVSSLAVYHACKGVNRIGPTTSDLRPALRPCGGRCRVQPSVLHVLPSFFHFLHLFSCFIGCGGGRGPPRAFMRSRACIPGAGDAAHRPFRGRGTASRTGAGLRRGPCRGVGDDPGPPRRYAAPCHGWR